MSEKESKGYGCFVMFVSGVALLIALIALLKWDKPTEWLSGESYVITALSALITFVVAWQIWQTIASRHEIERAMKAGEQLEKLRTQLKKAQEISAGHVLRTEAARLFSQDGQRYVVFQTLCECLRLYIAGQADMSKHIIQVLSQVHAIIDNNRDLRDNDWVITREIEINSAIDEIGAELTTLESDTAQARSQLESMRRTINSIRFSSAVSKNHSEE